MITEGPLTDKEIFWAVVKQFTILPAGEQDHLFPFFKDITEFKVDGRLAGYIFIMDYFGTESIHGYKLIPGYGLAAYRILKRYVAKYPKAFISLTDDKKKVIRLIRMLGFVETQRISCHGTTILKMERLNAPASSPS